MILAHLPAGYLQFRALRGSGKVLLSACLLGAVAPDLDMFWFLLVDHSIHHHRFWPHIPALWFGLLASATLVAWRTGNNRARWLAVFALAGMVHMVLDTLAGGIMWLWPLSDHLFTGVTVPATRSNWVLSFMVHWTFLAEIVIIAVAGGLMLFKRKPR